jgi:hypothetical protein
VVSFRTEEERPWHIQGKYWPLVEEDIKIPQPGRIMLHPTFELTPTTFQSAALQFESTCLETVMHIELSNAARHGK